MLVFLGAWKLWEFKDLYLQNAILSNMNLSCQESYIAKLVTHGVFN